MNNIDLKPKKTEAITVVVRDRRGVNKSTIVVSPSVDLVKNLEVLV